MAFFLIVGLFLVGDSSDYFISKNGTDSPGCGIGLNNTCGTLYYASFIFQNQTAEAVNVYIVDGQNETQINEYINNQDLKINPCLPLPVIIRGTMLPVSFIFDDRYIKRMTDWYPFSCHSINANFTYMFNIVYEIVDFSSVWIQLFVNNLIIEDYMFHPLYYGGLLYSNVYAQFNNLTLHNISSLSYETAIYSSKILEFVNSSFLNISVNSDFDFMFGEDRIIFQNVKATNIRLKYSSFISSINSVMIYNSDFVNVSSHYSLIHIEDNLQLIMQNCVILAVNNGKIVYSNENTQASTTDTILEDIVITTSQIEGTIEAFSGLFHFESAPFESLSKRIKMSNIYITYYYYLFENCDNSSIMFNTFNTTIVQVFCENPATFIWYVLPDSTVEISNLHISSNFLDNNNNIMSMDEMRLDILQKYGYGQSDMINQNVIVEFEYIQDNFASTLLYFLGTINVNVLIDGLYIHGTTLSSYFMLILINDGDIKINEFHVLNNVSVPNPNDLHSFTLLLLFAGTNTVIVNSTLASAHILTYALTVGDLYFDNTSFHDAYSGIHITAPTDGINNINIDFCSFYRLGVYYGNIRFFNSSIMFLGLNIPLSKIPVLIEMGHDQQLMVIDCVFSFHSPSGLFKISQSNDAYFNDNLFLSNKQNQIIWYNKNITKNIEFLLPTNGLVQIERCNNIHLIGNYFGQNEIDSTMPILYINHSNVCLSGNTLHNYAMHLNNSVITSCFRKHLVENIIQSNYATCLDINYGSMDYKLAYHTGIFLIDNVNISTITISNSSIALDNVLFNVSFTSTSLPYVISNIQNGSLLFVDTMVSSNADFVYDSNKCDIICNQHLTSNGNNITQLSQLGVFCDNDYNFNENTNKYIFLQSNTSEYIHHLSPWSMSLIGSMEYYAGGLLQLHYVLSDKNNNTISTNNNYSYSSEVKIVITNDTLNMIEVLVFDGKQGCDICEIGIYIPRIVIDDVDTEYILNVVEENDKLFTEDITIKIISCPPGYGINRVGVQCRECTDGQFSLNSSNNALCHSCDEHKNNGVQCRGGNEIIISRNYWISINNNTVQTTICPFGYCCQLENGCNYIRNKSSLCAQFRNANSIMCGECNEGYSELFLSTACGKCSNTNYLFLLFPLILALIVTLYLLAIKSIHVSQINDNNINVNNNNKSKCIKYKTSNIPS
eukprot:509179_1